MVSRFLPLVMIGLCLVFLFCRRESSQHLLVLAIEPAEEHSVFVDERESLATMACPSDDESGAVVPIEPYVRPELAARMADLRPVMLAAAARHNRPELSGMNDVAFAQVIALVLYNEHNGWFEDEIEPLRVFTPLYQQVQVSANQSGIGSNFSIWPTNLRPSVALEILRQQVPVPDATRVMTVPLSVYGSRIVLDEYATQDALYAAISAELSQDELAIEYLAANLERGLYRARFEGVPVTWYSLAAWHNQGIMQLDQVRRNQTACDYVRRTAAYLPLAEWTIDDGR